jgi:hypothetical protein
MAKKQSLNYGPNTALIKGARDVAQSEAAMTSAGGIAFAQSFTSAILTGIEEQEKRNSIRDAYLADLGGVQNINLLDEDYNKQAVTSFVRQQRDKYAKLADAYARTKDTDILDKMENIKFSFSNLNNQLKGLANERVEYLDAYDKGQIIDIPQRGDGIYTTAYTNKGKFSVDDTGNIGFNIDGKTTMFKDIAGKYNVKSNIGESFILEQSLKARTTGESGKKFYRDDTKNIYKFKFKETGPEGIMVMAKTDLTGDDEYTLPNGQKAGNLSFESMWSQGLLDKKFYEIFKAKGGTDWMYEDKNVDILNDLISEYYTDVTESMYTPAKQAFDNKAKNSQTTGPSTYYLSGVAVNSESFNAVVPKFIKDLQNLKDGEYEKNTITGAGFVRKGKNKDGNPIYYRVSGIKDGKPIIDEDLGPMDLQGVGRYEGWGNYFSFTKEDPLNPN